MIRIACVALVVSAPSVALQIQPAGGTRALTGVLMAQRSLLQKEQTIPTTSTNSTGNVTILLAEQRCMPQLPLVLLTAHLQLPTSQIHLWYGMGNADFVQRSSVLQRLSRAGALVLKPLPDPYFHHMNRTEYGHLFRKMELWIDIPSEKVLTLQADTLVCNDAPRKIASIDHFDYIGAPCSGAAPGALLRGRRLAAVARAHAGDE